MTMVGMSWLGVDDSNVASTNRKSRERDWESSIGNWEFSDWMYDFGLSPSLDLGTSCLRPIIIITTTTRQ